MRGRDITGQRFGKLTAASPTKDRKYSSIVWDCVCGCGRHVKVASSDLTTDRKRECDDCKKTKYHRIIEGERFGELTAVEPTNKRYKGAVIWRCMCDCGNIIHVPSFQLNSGAVKNCRDESTHKTHTVVRESQRYGQLIAINATGEKAGTSKIWHCKCDCGNTRDVSAYLLSSGQVINCGDYSVHQKRKRNSSIAGQKFGYLTAIKPTDERKSGSVVWECVCDCGNTTHATASGLNSKQKKSCGDKEKHKRMGIK